MATNTAPLHPNLYLIGFMGVGKSSVGRAVAKRLNLEFIDSDWCIEQAVGQPIPKIFETQGEPAFRALERSFIERGHPAAGCVVSCGGGLPVQPGMRELLLQKGVVICLFARIETILERTAGNDRRPLLNVEDRELRIRRLLEERLPIYMNTGIGVSADGRTVPEIVGNVVRVYEREARIFRSQRQQPPQA